MRLSASALARTFVASLAIVDNLYFVRAWLHFRPAAIVVFEKVDGVARPTRHRLDLVVVASVQAYDAVAQIDRLLRAFVLAPNGQLATQTCGSHRVQTRTRVYTVGAVRTRLVQYYV